jgi:tripartite-type tricarboxylate transporter receptor subunit TctC
MTVVRSLALGVAAALATGSARAADDNFFAGKTLVIFAGFAAGGGVDGNMRVVARHLGEHIPGKPTIVAKNMPGAAGVTNANFLYDKTEPDGLSLAMPGRNWMLAPLLKEAGARYDPLRFAWIGSPGAVNTILWVRNDSGIRTLADLMGRTEPVVLGALRVRSTNALGPLILSRNAGWPLKVILGFEATSRIMLAIEQREVEGTFVQKDTFLSSRADLVRSKVVIPLVQSRDEEPGVPLFWDHIPKAVEPLMRLAMASDDFGLPLVGPPGIPRERVEVLRAAFLSMARSRPFIEDSEKIGAPAGNPVDGATLERMVADTVRNASEAVLADYERLRETLR